tara:strand:- start:2172 stop:2957 length:786 start_codon:yes stop_codon:yes gene_type:complete
MKFIHISDIHLVSKDGPLNGSVPSERLEKCMDDILKWHADADFCVISGDLSEFAEIEAYQSLKNRVLEFPIPCFLMIGNHDDRDLFRTVFPDNPSDENNFVQYSFETNDGIFLFLDTKKQGKNVHDGELCEKRLAWLKKQLINAGNKATYLFMHHPPFEIGIPYMDKIRLFGSDQFLSTLSHGENIRHTFYGHVHRLTFVKWHGYTFSSLTSLNHQSPLVAESVQGEFCDEAPAYGVVLINGEQLTVHFNNFLDRKPLHQT